MFEVPEIDLQTTDGEIAVINLESRRRRSWSRFYEDTTRDGAAESVIENEQLTLQFVGDISALERVEWLAARRMFFTIRSDGDSGCTDFCLISTP
jgi:hypothetical protein